MAQVNLEIVSRPQGISLPRRRRRQRLRRAVIRRDLRRGRRRQFLRIQQLQRLDIRRPRRRQTVRLLERLHRVLRTCQECAGAFARNSTQNPSASAASSTHPRRSCSLSAAPGKAAAASPRRDNPASAVGSRRDVAAACCFVFSERQLQRGAEFRDHRAYRREW